MIISVEYILKAVCDSLEKEVLPYLDPSSGPASNVRSCLMMLASAEQRVALEGKLVHEDNRALRDLLRQAVAHAEGLALEAALHSDIRKALDAYPDRPDYYGISDAIAENQAYLELLTRLIRQRDGDQSSTSEEARTFRPALHRYLKELNQRDMKLLEKALTRLPV